MKVFTPERRYFKCLFLLLSGFFLLYTLRASGFPPVTYLGIEQGCITVAVAEKEDKVEITVADTGSGIPASVGDKLFDKFYQVQEKGIEHL